MKDCPVQHLRPVHRVSQIMVRGEGGPGGIFLPGGKNMKMSDFDDLNLFQS